MWIIFAVITVVLWGTSETIFKSVSNEETDSVLKLISYNGIVLGICAVVFMVITKTNINLNIILTYLPVSIIFITSMFFTYKAMKFIKISIISPLQNSSCAITCLLCVVLLKQELSIIQLIAIISIVIGIILLSINKSEIDKSNDIKNYIVGILFALGYWLLDGIGSFLDDYTLDETLTAEQLIIAFSFIYCIIGIVSFIILKIKNRNLENIYLTKAMPKLIDKKLIGTLIETVGQYTYIYTFAFGEAALASPFISAYSIVSLVLSRIFLKEKLNKKQYGLILLILLGLITLSIE